MCYDNKRCRKKCKDRQRAVWAVKYDHRKMKMVRIWGDEAVKILDEEEIQIREMKKREAEAAEAVEKAKRVERAEWAKRAERARAERANRAKATEGAAKSQ
ncbi:hypothetical protein IAT38_000984 [Cryptococcus sp. DSM 104549]